MGPSRPATKLLVPYRKKRNSESSPSLCTRPKTDGHQKQIKWRKYERPWNVANGITRLLRSLEDVIVLWPPCGSDMTLDLIHPYVLLYTVIFFSLLNSHFILARLPTTA